MDEKMINLINDCALNMEDINTLLESMQNDLRYLIQPMGMKSIWEKCAKIIITLGYPYSISVIDELFQWLQDMNWPGATLIRDFLLTIPANDFMLFYEDAITKAKEINDDEWIYNLELLLKLKHMS